MGAGVRAALIAMLIAAPALAQTPAPSSLAPAQIPRPVPRPDSVRPSDTAPSAANHPPRPATTPDEGEATPPSDTVRLWPAVAGDDFGYWSCLFGLSMLGVRYRPEAAVRSEENPECGIARPVRVTEIQPGVALPGAPLMRCELARKLALWMRNEVRPALHRLPGAPMAVALETGAGFQCRARVGGDGARLSEHALGNAIDIAGQRLSTGDSLPIAPREDSGDMKEAVQKAIRHGACLYFTTVLGPGSNAAHEGHLHFDLAARKNGWRICE